MPVSLNNDSFVENGSPGENSGDNSTSTNNNPANKEDKPKDKRVEWSKENEQILVEWCDVAQCYKWLNSRSHLKYAYMNAWFTIPAIVLSTVSGTASFAQASIPVAYQTYAPMAIGSINILIGILTTVQQYLKISELNESHRVSAISWDKFARNIRIELAKAPKERADAATFIKMSRQEFDRLMETSPAIPQNVIRLFDQTFSGKKHMVVELCAYMLGCVGIEDKVAAERKRQYDALKKPDICNIIVTANDNRHKWYELLEKETSTEVLASGSNDLENIVIGDILERENELRRKEQELHDLELKLETAAKADRELVAKRAAEEVARQEHSKKEAESRVKSAIEKIENFVTMFSNMRGRRPIPDEIKDNFNGNFDDSIMELYLTQYVYSVV
jgi:hypothetical protein